MSISWTEEQEQVIFLRNRAILVSAAAGSGKTAVLVERIIQMVTDIENPVDIDRLLIVTFTNAAASEMRERITQAIEAALEKTPEDVHLQRQQTLIHTAQITTIDSFCLSVIRDHFDVLDLDPSFRIGDEGEKKLLKSDVAEKLLEDYYEEGNPEFFRFVESYSTGKNDSGLEELILRLYEFAVSYPDPEEWLKDCLKEYQGGKTKAMTFLMDYLKRLAEDCYNQLVLAEEICNEAGGPYMYLPALSSDLVYLERLCNCKTYEEFGEEQKNVKFIRLSSKRDEAVNPELKRQVKEIRDMVKDEIRSIGKQFYFQPLEMMRENMEKVGKKMEVMIRLTIDFLNRYQEKKRERNLLDFSDVEHLALDILTKKTETKRVPSVIAQEYKEQFTEIMIDEYQDSNLVQEAILFSISTYYEEVPNVFMVGDVKQSIYKFRLARPELFMEKYETYTKEEGKYQKIDLHKNFRSRKEVISSINDIFYQIMRKELGGVDYDDDAALYLGAEFPENDSQIEDKKTELIVIDKSSQEEVSDAVAEEITSLELEAKAIVSKIQKLTDKEKGMKIYDKQINGYRTAQYRDIVILLRTVLGWGDAIVNACMEEGIPAHTQSQTGYFTAVEVQTVLNLLRIIDNPRQDIPLVGVLRSPIGNFSSLELAKIRAFHQKGDFYEALFYSTGEEVLDKKVQAFLDQLEYFRSQAVCMSIHELIRMILKETGYGVYASSMPAGTRRRMNLDILLEKAVAFETTSYRGVFHFIRYIEKLYKNEVDFGEASVVNEQDNTVRVMSIHKSKGLEFPIVIVAGMGKKLNQIDATQKAVIHPDLGIGLDYVDYERRTKTPVLVKRIIQKSIRLENLAEELRILYVAMTRAKEKLILIGVTDKAKERVEKWRRKTAGGRALSFASLANAENYFDWVVPAFSKESCELIFCPQEHIVKSEMVRQKTAENIDEMRRKMDFSKEISPELKAEIERRFSYQYPYQEETMFHAKTSVSELKRRNQEELEEETQALIEQEELFVPKFLKQSEKEIRGIARGTAYHTFLQNINFIELSGNDKKVLFAKVEKEKQRLAAEKKLLKDEAKLISNQQICDFLTSKIADRIRKAQQSGKLFKEKQFVVGVPARELYTDCQSKELILLQGVIDVYFEEEGELVLLDYKTDFVEEGQEEMLFLRYGKQFELYEKALEQMTGKKVKEKILYSFSLGKELLYGIK